MVAAHLEAHGYEIVARRRRIAGCEIDLVARRDATVALVEVKTRQKGALVHGALAVGARKRARLIRAAKVAAGRRGWRGDEYRIDVAVVTWDSRPVDRPPQIDYLENAVRIGLEA